MTTPWLLCRVGGSACALPLGHVIEVMRPLPVVPIAQAPAGVLGMCVMRGASAPVIDLALCLCGLPGTPTRFVAVHGAPPSSGERAHAPRRLALAVDAVVGTIQLAPERVERVPPLLARAAAGLEAMVALDSSLLLLLQTARLVAELKLPELPSHVGSH